MKRKRSRLYSFILAWFMLLACIPTQASAANLPPGTSKAVVFLLDASNSMNTNDRERLAKDSIAQHITPALFPALGCRTAGIGSRLWMRLMP